MRRQRRRQRKTATVEKMDARKIPNLALSITLVQEPVGNEQGHREADSGKQAAHSSRIRSDMVIGSPPC